ncbi:DUF3570 domain-containing protein [Roseateles amylovorans]|uniref:DUF3570 domain-containing protein n=1 Tax=Roseateles amylovorans TaxID=2978473 RepID=A0ABY6B669_9BURK|nr:DUF3570 domain-containing protein [Roseateles amylovorans]UXH80327.1 DUF3570 domain-containing protein [Roseateles amylovorans]
MVATEKHRWGRLGSISLAAMALPGVMLETAIAQEMPTEGIVAYKQFHYSEEQPAPPNSVREFGRAPQAWSARDLAGRSGSADAISGASGAGTDGRRVRVSSPSLYVLAPFGGHWAAQGSFTRDSVSGATPQYYSDMRGARQMQEVRNALDAKISRFWPRSSLSVGTARSEENDYISQAFSAQTTQSSEDQNTVWNLGVGLTRDRINPANERVVDERRQTLELELGVTYVWSSKDVFQLNLASSRARGYLSDPYKLSDRRPRQRDANTGIIRWNRWLGSSALKSSYRYYADSYGIRSHTIELGLATPMLRHLTLTPSLRYYSQNSADFFGGPGLDGFPAPPPAPKLFSADQRLAAFGALTAGLKIEWQVDQLWLIDYKLEKYRQQSNWALPSQRTTFSLDRLDAIFWQFGISRRF